MFDLIESLTIQNILDLGFECQREGHLYYLPSDDGNKRLLDIHFQDKTICLSDEGIYKIKATNMIIKMIKLGYIVKGEE